jgi:oligoribonuclease
MSKIMLVGCDLETGGLNGYETLENGERVHGALHYPILEMAFVICDDKLNELNRFSIGIWDESFLERLDPWALDKHTESGLIDQLRNATGDHIAVFSDNDSAELFVIERLMSLGLNNYDRKAKTGGILFGNSVGFDVSYLDAQMPSLKGFFHYRTIDVSSIDLLRQTAWASVGLPKVEKTYAHTAMSDISETLMELKAYSDVFRPICVATGSSDVLMSRDNPNGWKLEDILLKLRKEVADKDHRLLEDTSMTAREVHHNNKVIFNALDFAYEAQTNSIRKLLADKGKDQGPEGTPRIGA